MTAKRKWTDYIKNSILVILFFMTTSPVSALGNSKNLNLDFNMVYEHLDTTINKDDKGLNINYYSQKYNENAYVYLYQTNKDNWTSYDAIVLQVENKSDKPQNITLQIGNNSKSMFKVKENGIIFLEDSETKSYRKGKILYSNVEIPAKFKGKVYITFDNFINKENNTKLSKEELKNITSWGMALIPSSEGENIITLNKVNLLREESLNTLEYLKNIQIIGNDKVQIPMVGESIEIYKVEGKDNIKFSLLKDYNGVNLSNDGKLTVNDKASAGDINFEISINNEIKYEKTVALTHSWAFNQADEDGVPYGLLPPDKSPTVNEMNKFIYLEKYITFIKILLVTMSFVCPMIYIYWNHERNRQHRKED